MFAPIKDCVTEAWQKTTTIGKVTLIPMLLSILVAVYMLVLPLLALDALVSKCFRILKRCFKRILFKQRSAEQVQKEE